MKNHPNDFKDEAVISQHILNNDFWYIYLKVDKKEHIFKQTLLTSHPWGTIFTPTQLCVAFSILCGIVPYLIDFSSFTYEPTTQSVCRVCLNRLKDNQIKKLQEDD